MAGSSILELAAVTWGGLFSHYFRLPRLEEASGSTLSVGNHVSPSLSPLHMRRALRTMSFRRLYCFFLQGVGNGCPLHICPPHSRNIPSTKMGRWHRHSDEGTRASPQHASPRVLVPEFVTHSKVKSIGKGLGSTHCQRSPSWEGTDVMFWRDEEGEL